MIAEAIFNSKIRYGIALYLNPVFEEEDLKMKRNYQKILLPYKHYRTV